MPLYLEPTLICNDLSWDFNYICKDKLTFWSFVGEAAIEPAAYGVEDLVLTLWTTF